jgi:hypothetical protein
MKQSCEGVVVVPMAIMTENPLMKVTKDLIVGERAYQGDQGHPP